MYQIMDYETNELLAYCDEPRWVRRNTRSGAWVQCSKEDAEAIAACSRLWSIWGRDPVEEAAGTAIAIRVEDSGRILFDTRSDIGEAKVEIEGATDCIAELDEASVAGEERISALEEMILELDARK